MEPWLSYLLTNEESSFVSHQLLWDLKKCSDDETQWNMEIDKLYQRYANRTDLQLWFWIGVLGAEVALNHRTRETAKRVIYGISKDLGREEYLLDECKGRYVRSLCNLKRALEREGWK